MKRVMLYWLLAAVLIPTLVHASLPFIEKDGETIAALRIEMRPRWELEGRDFNDDTGLSDYGTMRTMIGIDVMPLENFLLRLSFQESRYLGTQSADRAPAAQMEVREAYFRLDNLFDKNIAVQAGRFTWETGRGRLFGYNDWSLHGPNAYEGLILEWPCGLWPDKGRWSMLAARVRDHDFAELPDYYVYPGEYPRYWDYWPDKRDRNLIVLSGNFIDGLLQPIIALDIDSRVTHKKPFEYYERSSYYHGGLYAGETWGALSFNVDAIYQYAMPKVEYYQWYGYGFDERYKTYEETLESWVLAADVGYKFDAPTKPGITIGFDRTEGQNAENDDTFPYITYRDYSAFNSPFASNREFRGLMNIDWSYFPKLSDYFATVDLDPFSNLHLETAYHRFIAVGEKDEGSDQVDLGHEIDFEMTWKVNEYLEIVSGYSVFFPVNNSNFLLPTFLEYVYPYGGEYPTDKDSAEYAWLTAVVRF